MSQKALPTRKLAWTPLPPSSSRPSATTCGAVEAGEPGRAGGRSRSEQGGGRGALLQKIANSRLASHTG